MLQFLNLRPRPQPKLKPGSWTTPLHARESPAQVCISSHQNDVPHFFSLRSSLKRHALYVHYWDKMEVKTFLGCPREAFALDNCLRQYSSLWQLSTSDEPKTSFSKLHFIHVSDCQTAGHDCITAVFITAAVRLSFKVTGCSRAVIRCVLKSGVKAELSRPLVSVREDVEGEECAGFVYTGDYLISMSTQREASEGSCHSAATSEPSKTQIQPSLLRY
ncbi:hypothetical protein JOB18_039716 [Solea senegalensis]|uniref:Uncharacterized protein n=1 Tax=Solea senegalensis TaxID=28829 RepID=A0AAV6RWF3_SOLSE|nr:hypothetical protein JOB18_039716 [Solea senegalensis]